MESMKKRILSLFLTVLIFANLIGVEPNLVNAASFNDINQSSVFVKQKTSNTCTLASAVMMVRRAAMMSGNGNWSSITENSMRSTAWTSGGLRHTFTYAGITVGYRALSGGSGNSSTLKSFLEAHPEGIVAYGKSAYGNHAVLLTDYSDGTFYCSDPSNYVSSGRIPLVNSSMSGSGQSGKVAGFYGYWYVISPKVSLSNGNQGNGASISLSTIPDGIYRIETKLDSGKCLDIYGASADDSANVQIYSNNASSAQRFRFVRHKSGYYYIYNEGSGKCLDVRYGDMTEGTNVQQYTFNGTDAQLWGLVDTGGGYYNIVSKKSGLYLDVSGGKGEDYTNVQVWSGNGTKAQMWKIHPTSNVSISEGVYNFETALESEKYLDIFGASSEDCANAQIYTDNATDAQRFTVKGDKKAC